MRFPLPARCAALTPWAVTAEAGVSVRRLLLQLGSGRQGLARSFSGSGGALLSAGGKGGGGNNLTPSASEAEKRQQLQTKVNKAKENAKTAGYGGVILAGLCVTGAILYTIGRELFSGQSPQVLFLSASDRCIRHAKVQDLLGEPIKAFGEESRRGRRNHVSSMDYQDKNGRRGVIVQFYLQGMRRRATARLDAREDSSGKMQTRYLLVTVDDMLKSTVIVEDNRKEIDQ